MVAEVNILFDAALIAKYQDLSFQNLAIQAQDKNVSLSYFSVSGNFHKKLKNPKFQISFPSEDKSRSQKIMRLNGSSVKKRSFSQFLGTIILNSVANISKIKSIFISILTHFCGIQSLHQSFVLQ